MAAAIFKVIYGIPLWLMGLFAKGFGSGVKFLAELVGILAFKARWYISAIFWLFVLYGLIKIEPFIKDNAPQPIWAVYIRFIIVLMGLMLLAFVTKNLRRAFRRARMELRVLSAVDGAKKHVVNIRGGNGKDDNTDTPSPGFVAKLVALMQSRQRLDETTHIVTVKGGKEGSYEETLAQIIATENAQVQAAISGEHQPKERPEWMKSRRADKKGSTGVDPLLRAGELEEEAERLRQGAKRSTKRARNKSKPKTGEDG